MNVDDEDDADSGVPIFDSVDVGDEDSAAVIFVDDDGGEEEEEEEIYDSVDVCLLDWDKDDGCSRFWPLVEVFNSIDEEENEEEEEDEDEEDVDVERLEALKSKSLLVEGRDTKAGELGEWDDDKTDELDEVVGTDCDEDEEVVAWCEEDGNDESNWDDNAAFEEKSLPPTRTGLENEELCKVEASDLESSVWPAAAFIIWLLRRVSPVMTVDDDEDKVDSVDDDDEHKTESTAGDEDGDEEKTESRNSMAGADAEDVVGTLMGKAKTNHERQQK